MEGHAPILVVEDNESDTTLIRRALTNAGIPNPQRFVESGEEAIKYLAGAGTYSDREQYPLPVLVLLDLKLPGMQGFDVVKWIRAHRRFKDLRVLVLTSSIRIRDVNEAYRLGANSFLVKPLNFHNVREVFSMIQREQTEHNVVAPALSPPRTASVAVD